jgi:hypothetical protein
MAYTVIFICLMGTTYLRKSTNNKMFLLLIILILPSANFTIHAFIGHFVPASSQQKQVYVDFVQRFLS